MLKPFDEALRELVSQYESAHYDPTEMRTIMAEIGRELTHDRAPNYFNHGLNNRRGLTKNGR